MHLNSEQLKIVEHISSPLCVLAGAGTGKTRCIVAKLVYLIRQGYNPSRILTLTFSKKAADEIKQRVNNLTGSVPEWTSTFHSFAMRILKSTPSSILDRLGIKRNFTVTDRNDAIHIMKTVTSEFTEEAPEEIYTILSKHRQSYYETEEELKLRLERELSLPALKAAMDYLDTLKKNNRVDFDDLQLYLVRLLLYGNLNISERFSYVLVDEFQDTNDIEMQIIELLVPRDASHITVVGDVQQSIYEFRGARPSNVKRFIEHYRPEIMYLQLNYRSAEEILHLANSISDELSRYWQLRMPVLESTQDIPADITINIFEDSDQEAAFIAETVSKASPSDTVILARRNSILRDMESHLIRAGIPCKVEGDISFLERAEIKDVLSYLQFAMNPRDSISFRRAVQVPRRGIGEAKINRILSLTDSKTDILQAIEIFIKSDPGANYKLQHFLNIIKKIAPVAQTRPWQSLRILLSEIDLKAYLEKTYKSTYRQRLDSIEELSVLLKRYEEDGKTLTDLYIDFRDEDTDTDNQRIKLMTIHRAKGLEWPHVILIATEDGIFPDYRSDINEELRLLYVAITRAKHTLTITASKRRFFNGNYESRRTSSFISFLKQRIYQSTCVL